MGTVPLQGHSFIYAPSANKKKRKKKATLLTLVEHKYEVLSEC